MSANVVLLDACCLINIAARSLIPQIFNELPYRFGVAAYVLEHEAINCMVPDPGTGVLIKRTLDLHPVVEEGLLLPYRLEGEREANLVVQYVSEGLDDGEAITCAIAVVRGFAVATDDRKGWRMLEELGVPLASTISLVREFTESRNLTAAEVTALVKQIRERGRFLAPRSRPVALMVGDCTGRMSDASATACRAFCSSLLYKPRCSSLPFKPSVQAFCSSLLFKPSVQAFRSSLPYKPRCSSLAVQASTHSSRNTVIG